MNKKRRKIIFVVGIVILLLIAVRVTKPSANSFDDWLTKKYSIVCNDRECFAKFNEEDSFKVVRRDADNYFLFNKMEIVFEYERGGFKLVEGIGVLGGYIPLTYKPYYEQ